MTYLNPEAMTPRQRAVGAARRLRALAWMGHGPEYVAAVYGIDFELASRVLWEDDKLIRAWFPVEDWYGIVIAFDDLAMKFGPSQWMREVAIERGWKPPLAWDDDTIDHPLFHGNVNPKPPESNTFDHAAVDRRCTGDHTVPMRFQDYDEAVRRMHSRGFNDGQIGRQLGISAKQVHRSRSRLRLRPASRVA